MDSAEKIRSLLNDANQPPKPLTSINLRMDLPVVEAGDGYNTKLEIEGIPGRGYYGSGDIFYKRIPLENVINTNPLRSTDPLTPEIVLTMFNSVTGLFLTVDDLEPFTPPVLADGESGSVVVTALSTSLGFTGSVEIFLEYGRSWLNNVVGVRTLPVLNHPIQVGYLKSARMLTWSKDFTSLRDSIKVDPKTNQFTDWDTLQAACTELHIPAWEQGRITDNATSAIPDANPLFHRVIIQRNVYSTGMQGDVYLHYNILEEV